jgi:hypothetical protein
MKANRDLIHRLKRLGINDNEQLLKAGRTSLDRYGLAQALGVEVEQIERLVNRADMSRVHGLDEECIDLLAATGVICLRDLARAIPDRLLARLSGTGAESVAPPPDPQRIQAWVSEAAHLPREVWE